MFLLGTIDSSTLQFKSKNIVVCHSTGSKCVHYLRLCYSNHSSFRQHLQGKDSADASKLWFVLLLVIKFVYTLVPILVAMGVSNLVSILKFLGALVIFYNFVIPLLLQLTSQRLCYKTFWQILQSSYDLNDSSHENSRLVPSSVKPSDLYMTPYSNIFSHWPVVAVIGVMTHRNLPNT